MAGEPYDDDAQYDSSKTDPSDLPPRPDDVIRGLSVDEIRSMAIASVLAALSLKKARARIKALEEADSRSWKAVASEWRYRAEYAEARVKALEGVLDRLLEHGGTRGRYHAIRWAEAVHEAECVLAGEVPE